MFARFLACTPDRLLLPADYGLLAVLDDALASGRAALRSRMYAPAICCAIPRT